MSYRHPLSPEDSPQVVSLSGSSAQSAAFGATAKAVRVCSDTDCFVAFGSNPTATTSSIYLPAKVPQVFGIQPGQKVAAIGTSGKLYVTEATSVL